MTILLVEQNFRFASRVADRFYLMEHGRIVYAFPVRELDARHGTAPRCVWGSRTDETSSASPSRRCSARLLIGLINGSFYALLSPRARHHLRPAARHQLRPWRAIHARRVHRLSAARHLGIGYWPALILAPLIVGLFGMAVERLALSRLYDLDPLYGLLLHLRPGAGDRGRRSATASASRAIPIAVPPPLAGGTNLGFMFLPIYRGWVVVGSLVICLGTWLLIEKTRFGAYLRAATENPKLVQAFGVNVPPLLTLTYGLGAALGSIGRHPGRAGLSGEPADGLESDHRRVRGSRGRRHGLDPWARS